MVNPQVNSEWIAPSASTDVFVGQEDNRFAIGVFDGNIVTSDLASPLIRDYLRMRAERYIKMGFLKQDARRKDGTELDADDERSTHFVVLENILGGTAIVGCLRLIEKRGPDNRPLPVEGFFPEAFPESASEGSIEISRFIIHPDAGRREEVKRQLFATGMAHVLQSNLGPIYATMERPLERTLRVSGIPMKRFSETRLVPEYHTENSGIEIDRRGVEAHLGEETLNHSTVSVGSFGYWGEAVLAEIGQRA